MDNLEYLDKYTVSKMYQNITLYPIKTCSFICQQQQKIKVCQLLTLEPNYYLISLFEPKFTYLFVLHFLRFYDGESDRTTFIR